MTRKAKEDLLWWSKNLAVWNGKTISGLSPEITIETDASNIGWGAFSQGEKCWSPEERTHRINWLELQAVYLALRAFLKETTVKSVLIPTDNTAVNKMGKTQ